MNRRAEGAGAMLGALEQALAAMDAGRPRTVSLPAGGELYLDHALPFLAVYREPVSQPDPGTARLVRSEAAYLVAPASGEQLQPLRRLLKRLIERHRERFGAFLILELWAGAAEAPGEGRSEPRQGAAFRIHAAPRPELTGPVEALLRSLGQVRIGRQDPEVTAVRAARWSPPRCKPLLRPQEALAEGCRLVGVEVSPIYRTAEGELYPVVLGRLRRKVSVAMQRAAHRFAVATTRAAPVSYQAYGKHAVEPTVRKVDERLAEVSLSYDFLVKVTPINLGPAWLQFRRDRLDREPEFLYHPLAVDPCLTKRRLFEVPIERIEDPTLGALFREKQLNLDRELTMLLDRGTRRFLHGSLQLFGGVEPELHDLARALLAKLPPSEPVPAGEVLVDADAFATRAREEIAYYRERAPGFDARVEVRENLYTDIMTSHGTLLVGSRVRVPRSAVEPYLQHEIGTHALTYHNGRAQPFQLLVVGLPGYDELQEGLAVLAEHLAGGLSASRLRWLAGRVVAVQMVIAGASFVETFRALHRDYGFKQEVAFTTAARVHRGGGLTKDAVYLRGLRHVLRHLKDNWNMDVLLVGKVAARHIPILEELHLRHVLRPPPFRPRYLLDYGAQQRLKRVREGLTVLDLIGETP